MPDGTEMINYRSLLSVALFANLSQEAPKALSEFTERERTSALQSDTQAHTAQNKQDRPCGRSEFLLKVQELHKM